MGRSAKVTKYSLQNALSHSLTVSGVALYLGVDRHTVYDAAKRFEVDLSTALARIPTPPPAPEILLPVPPEPVVEPPPIKAERNILRLTMDDFTGRNRGDPGESRPTVWWQPRRYY